jgi:Flp pilus assembly CpaE family ATPase
VEVNTLTILLIEDSPQYAQLVQHWLAHVPGSAGFVLHWTDSLADGMNRLARGGVDVILLDLGLPDCSGMDTFKQTRAQAPRTPIVILSSADSEALALQMIQDGAEDYLVKSTCDADTLARAVRRAVVRRKALEVPSLTSLTASRVIAVLGAKGGNGTTTIACTLAAELRGQTGLKVLLADLDSSGGLVSFVTGVDCQYSMRDAAANLQRMDLNFWNSLVTEDPDGLNVIPSGQVDDQELDGANLREVVNFTRPLYSWTVLDLGRLNQKSLSLLGPDSEVFVVTTCTIPALYAAKRALEALRRADIDPERTRLIVNQMGEKQLVSRDALNSMFGVPVYATVPTDAAELNQACVQKRLPGMQSPFRKAIAELARKVTGVPEQKKSSLTSLVSFARFRKSSDRALVSSGTD